MPDAATLVIRRARLAGRDGLLDLVAEGSRIQDVRAHAPETIPKRTEVLDAGGRVVLPGFVDCHTHACWAGDRLGEWQHKLAGASYLDLLKAGGGIMATVHATRAASEQELAESLLGRLNVMLRHGTTTVEVKSGYGLDTENELKMLRAIHLAADRWPGSVVATACIGHAMDPQVEREEFVRRTVEETLPAVSAEFPGIAVDGYCEEGAWSLGETLRLTDAAQTAGHPVRMHADQFNALGMIKAAVEGGFRSVDHLEATGPEGLEMLAGSGTWGVMLPASGFHTDGRYGDGRAFIDAGGRLAIATNYNPGSSPCPAMPFVIALAVRKLGLSIDEALNAASAGGAAVLGFDDRGRLEPGARADLVILDTPDPRMLAFEFGANPVWKTIVAGG